MNYKDKILYQSNYWYNDGLRKAQIRDLSGAILSLRKSLQYNRENIAARNLLGLVYYGRGEIAEALVEWIISKNLKAHDNIANYYIEKVRSSQSELEAYNQAVKKFNQCLTYCEQGGEDLAIIQLKKIVASQPGFLKAQQLLALLYLHTEQYSKALQVLRSARKLDTTDEMTLRYTHEITQKKGKRSREPKERAANTITYKLGNETIIQPASAAMKGVVMKLTAANLALGIAIGAAVLWFLVLPAVVQSRTDANTKQIKEFSEQYAAQQAQISAQKKALDEYRNSSEETQAAAATASSTKDSYENLMTVSDQYNDGSYSNATMAETLLLVNRDSLGTSGQELYDRLAGDIFSAVCDRQYSVGVNDIDVGDYAGAIEALTQVIKMNESYGDGEGLYYLGVAYARNGDADNANTQFKRVIELFPDSDLASQAQDALDGKITTQSDNSSDDSYDDESYDDEE